MSPRQETLVLAAICAIVVLLSLIGLVWAVVTGLIFDIDGLMLVLVCLLMAGVFSLLFFSLVRRARLLAALSPARRKTTAPAEATGNSPAREQK